jgi:hypothetical protein
MTTNGSYAETRFAPQQLVGAAILASLFIAPASNGILVLARAMGFGPLVASQTSVLLVTGIMWLFFFACYIGRPIAPSVRPKIFAILGDPALSIGAKLKATFTNWFSLLAFASQLLMIASATLL